MPDTFSINNWVVVGRTRFEPPKKISDELIDEARIVHVFEGTSKLHSAHGAQTLRAGDTLVMKTDNFINHWQPNENGKKNEVIVFQLTASLLQHLYSAQLPKWFSDKELATEGSLVKASDHALIHSYFLALKPYFDYPAVVTEDMMAAKIRELLGLLIQTDSTGEMKSIFANLFTASEYAFKDTIAKNIFEDLSVEDLAFLCGLSLSSFKRKFSTIYGTTPNKYITSKRLDKAQTLLKTTELSISEIAYSCGFSDVSYFSKSYKKYYQTSPSALRS